MAKKSRFGIQFEGFEDLMNNFKKLGGDLKDVAEECLVKAHEDVTPETHQAMKKHHRTGKTEASIRDTAKVTWQGSTASIEVGFDLKQGGMPSIFLMYGTPRMKKDTKLYNAIYGSKVKKQIAKDQEEILQKAIQKRLGG